MHKSRLCGFIIDCKDADLKSAGGFWSEALGRKAKPARGAYIKFARGADGLNLEVQRVDHPSRVHLDIETDNVSAEVKRLEGLGAKAVGRVKSWVVMQAPTGHRFCVVRVQSPDFDKTANSWD